MVTIRLSRGGTNKKPYYRIVVADRRRAVQGKSIESVGFFNPRASANDQRLNLNLERLQYWISKGAKPTERVAHLIKGASASA